MRKIVICTMLCLLLIMLPPITVGLAIHQKSEGEPVVNEWTYLQGIITKPSYVNGDRYVTFRAIFVHYSTHWYGNVRTGFFHHSDVILLPRFHFGYLGSHLVFAKFNMALFP